MTNERAPLPYYNRVQPVTPPSPLRAPPARAGRCPRCRARIVSRDWDGPACILCGWHSWAETRPMLLLTDEVE